MITLALEKWFQKELKRPKKNLLHLFLFGFSLFFKWGSFFRNALFDFGLIRVYRSKKMVVSIGNIALGGTGKTPFTELLVKTIGQPVAILERGYRAKKRKKEPFIVSSPGEGDEAYLLLKKIEFAQVIIGKKRTKSAKFAEKLGVSYIVLDDGMQHRYLHRDIEVVVLHNQDLFGRGHFAPYGFLRESPKRLKNADYIIINGVKNEREFLLAETQVREYSDAKLIGGFYRVENGEEFRGKKVAAFCGIGKPEEFFRELGALGADVILRHVLRDHDTFKDFQSFKEKAFSLGIETIVCTEKDYVKLEDQRGVFALKIAFKVIFGTNHFRELVEEISKV